MTHDTKKLNLRVLFISAKVFCVLSIILTVFLGFHKEILYGLLLGTTASLLSFLFLSIYVEALLMRTSSARIKFGWFVNGLRLFIIITVIIAAIQCNESFNTIAVIAGLVIVQAGIILTEALDRPIIDRQNKNKEGGK